MQLTNDKLTILVVTENNKSKQFLSISTAGTGSSAGFGRKAVVDVSFSSCCSVTGVNSENSFY